MRFQLRDYQKEAIQSVIQHRKYGYRRLLICLPTGAGKTVIFSELCRMAKRNVLVLAHREELLEQAKEKIERMTEGKAIVSIEQGLNTSSDESTGGRTKKKKDTAKKGKPKNTLRNLRKTNGTRRGNPWGNLGNPSENLGRTNGTPKENL